MPFDHIEQLSAWLAEAGIDSLELSGPDGRLCLGRAEQDDIGPDEADAAIETVEAEIDEQQHGFAVRAPGAGILLHHHPMQQTPLAPCGARIRAGQTVALLQIGALLVPVDASCDGTVTSLLADHGALVGFGTAIIELSATQSESQNGR
jgi:acetyl-CoA carboxylase biotin carboxyl carrier protein